MSLAPKFPDFLLLWYINDIFKTSFLFPGQTIPWYILQLYEFETTTSTIAEVTILSLIYFIPVTTVMISAMVQLHVGVQHSRDAGTNIPLNNWAHINTTVLLLTAVFLICNSPSIAVFFVNNFWDLQRLKMEIVGSVTTILPLLNAVLTPVIIVTRNKDLLRDTIKRMKSVFCTET